MFNDKSNISNFSIKISGSYSKRVDYVKFLGVYIDSKLSWNEHINHVSSQVAKGVGVLSQLKHILPMF